MKERLLCRQAIANFKTSNNGNLPTDINQLKPYFKDEVSDAMLQRYQIVAGDSPIAVSLMNVANTNNLRVPGTDCPEFILTEKAPVDPRFDSRFSLYIRGKDTGDSWYTSIHNW